MIRVPLQVLLRPNSPFISIPRFVSFAIEDLVVFRTHSHGLSSPAHVPEDGNGVSRSCGLWMASGGRVVGWV